MHTILSGPINSGKSTCLMHDVQQWIREGKSVSGWISTPSSVVRIQSSAEKKEYDIVFITMSKIHERQRFIRITPFENSFAWKRFHFDQTVFDKAATIDFGQPDIFVIDEVGPLELENKKGFWDCLEGIYTESKNTLTVVRDSCVDLMESEFSWLEFEIVGPSI